MIGIDPWGLHHLQGRVIDLTHRINIENIAVFTFDHHHQHVCGAEHATLLLIKLNIRMPRGIKIEEVCIHPHFRGVDPQIYCHKKDGGHDPPTEFEKEVDVRFHPATWQHKSPLFVLLLSRRVACVLGKSPILTASHPVCAIDV